MPSDQRRVDVYVASEQWRQLERLREQTGAPLAESVRRAIKDYLARPLKSENARSAAKENDERWGLLRRVNFYVGSEQWHQLEARREQAGVSAAESVRRAIQDYLARHLKPEDTPAASKGS